MVATGMNKNETIRKEDPGLFDYQNRMKKLSEMTSPLEKLDSRIPWGKFRPDLEGAIQKEDKGLGCTTWRGMNRS